MAKQSDGITVKAQKDHTFNGQAYAAGDTYQVTASAGQTVDQYLETLRACGLATAVNEVREDTVAPVEPMKLPTPAPAPAPEAPAKAPAKPAPKPIKKG